MTTLDCPQWKKKHTATMAVYNIDPTCAIQRLDCASFLTAWTSTSDAVLNMSVRYGEDQICTVYLGSATIAEAWFAELSIPTWIEGRRWSTFVASSHWS